MIAAAGTGPPSERDLARHRRHPRRPDRSCTGRGRPSDAAPPHIGGPLRHRPWQPDPPPAARPCARRLVVPTDHVRRRRPAEAVSGRPHRGPPLETSVFCPRRSACGGRFPALHRLLDEHPLGSTDGPCSWLSVERRSGRVSTVSLALPTLTLSRSTSIRPERRALWLMRIGSRSPMAAWPGCACKRCSNMYTARISLSPRSEECWLRVVSCTPRPRSSSPCTKVRTTSLDSPSQGIDCSSTASITSPQDRSEARRPGEPRCPRHCRWADPQFAGSPRRPTP